MSKVVERFRLNSGEPVLICEWFDDDVITKQIKTDIGLFTEPEFALGTVTACFAPPTTRSIVIRTQKDCSKIKEIEFV